MKHNAVLIVDDEKNIRMILVQALEPLGIEMDTAVNGEEALEKIKNNHFDLILIDLKMPGMDGMDVLRQVSQMCSDIKFIVITAYATVDSAVEAMRLGAADFLQKPFSTQDIRESITRVMGMDEKIQGKQR